MRTATPPPIVLPKHQPGAPPTGGMGMWTEAHIGDPSQRAQGMGGYKSGPLLGCGSPHESPEFQGTQYLKLVIDPISQRSPPQLQSPWAEWHKKDGAGQWAVVLDMPTRLLNTHHVAPDVLHQIYPYVVWWAADLVATPQQKFPVGSPANV